LDKFTYLFYLIWLVTDMSSSIR